MFSRGPNIVRDGLAFGYDTGYGVANNTTSTRFYPGEPTENLLALGGSDTEIERSGTSYPYYSVNINSYVQSRWSATNNTLTISYESKRDYVAGGTGGGGDGYPVFYVYFTDWSWAQTLGNSSYDWYYKTKTFTMPDPTGKTVYFSIYHMNSGNPGKSYSRKHMLSFNSHAVPFINGTRSSTQSLLDLAKTTSISTSNISFDSTGQPVFDGTNDYITTGLYAGRNTSTYPFTVEAIVKANNTSAQMMWMDVDGNGSSQRFYSSLNTYGRPLNFGIQASGWTSGACEDTNYHHQVIVMDGSTARSYDNGIQVGTKSYSAYTLPSNIRVGARGGTSYLWNGEIPVFKIYDRALTANEIQQNFLAYKSRLGL